MRGEYHRQSRQVSFTIPYCRDASRTWSALCAADYLSIMHKWQAARTVPHSIRRASCSAAGCDFAAYHQQVAHTLGVVHWVPPPHMPTLSRNSACRIHPAKMPAILRAPPRRALLPCPIPFILFNFSQSSRWRGQYPTRGNNRDASTTEEPRRQGRRWRSPTAVQ